MAFVHRDATLRPTKVEVVRQWLAAADWFDADPETVVTSAPHTAAPVSSVALVGSGDSLGSDLLLAEFEPA